jgi:hypothetical protein
MLRQSHLQFIKGYTKLASEFTRSFDYREYLAHPEEEGCNIAIWVPGSIIELRQSLVVQLDHQISRRSMHPLVRLQYRYAWAWNVMEDIEKMFFITANPTGNGRWFIQMSEQPEWPSE